jgi:beta-1,4-glucosyltransferase
MSVLPRLDPPEFVNIFGIPIWNPAYDQFAPWWQASLADKDKPTLLGIVNAHTLNLAFERPHYAEVLRAMDALINDGVGARIAARMRRKPFQYNFNGTDLFPRIFSEQQEPLTVFLYGATEGSNAGAAQRIGAKWPHIKVVGRMNGFDASPPDVFKEIQKAGPDLLLVALGQPRQELFLHEHRNDLTAGVACGVGALFDFLSGTVPRAPQAFRKARMEWAYRLAKEPRRMFGRYVTGNPKFLVRARIWKGRDLS